MPRAGSGGGRSSSHRSSGSHSSSRSSGGHRISSSGSHSRAGSGRSSSSRSSSSSYRPSNGPSFRGAPPPPPSFRGPGMPPPPPPSRGYRRRSYRRTYYGGSAGGALSAVIVLIIVLAVLFAFFSVFFSTMSSDSFSNSAIPASTRNREKLDSGLSFDSNCIVDEISWFDSVSRSGRQLKTFYDKTGVQPYIVLLKYHPELVTDSQKEEYAQEYYEANIDNESTFLYMYFAQEDQDNQPGYMCYVNGKQVDSVMDAEAVTIFWGYIDKYWYSNMTTDELFEKAFTMTANTIMTKSKTKTDILFVVVIGIVVVGIIIGVIIAMNTKRKHERERAEETQRILNTPLPDNPLSSPETSQTNNSN